jgi:hypothetical protein
MAQTPSEYLAMRPAIYMSLATAIALMGSNISHTADAKQTFTDEDIRLYQRVHLARCQDKVARNPKSPLSGLCECIDERMRRSVTRAEWEAALKAYRANSELRELEEGAILTQKAMLETQACAASRN